MKNFLIRILLAAALTLVAFALASSAQAQQADVIGKLAMMSNTVRIDSIEPLS